MSAPDTLPGVDVLLPLEHAGNRIESDPQETELARLYAHPVTGTASGDHPGAYVRANMVSSLDGAAWGADHRSGSINNPADFRSFRVQRALADVVLVGAGTIRAEGYSALEVPPGLDGLRARSGRAPRIELAVVTRSGMVPAAVIEVEHPALIITTRAGAEALSDQVEPENVIIAGETEVDLTVALAALAARGLPRVLTEGGPHLLGSLLGADLVDELCLTFSPLLVGRESGRIVQGLDLPEALAAQPAHLLHSGGVLLGRWLLRNAQRPPAAGGIE